MAEETVPRGLPDPAATSAADEFASASHGSGESEFRFAARYALQKVDRFLEAWKALAIARVNGSSSDVVKKLEKEISGSVLFMEFAADQLREQLYPQPRS